MNEDDIRKHIDELRQTVIVASLNRDVWWAYKNQELRVQYTDTMNRYALFFQTGINAHFVATLIPLYRLYENKSDTYNIPKFLRHIENDPRFTSCVVELNEISDRAKVLWEKVRILRNWAFGHRSKAHSVDELFVGAKMTPNDLQNLLDLSKKILNKISAHFDGSVHGFNLNASNDVLRLLQDLKYFETLSQED